MKYVCLALFMASVINGYSQDGELETLSKNLQNEITKTEGAQRLFLLDSLTDLLKFKQGTKYDSIAKQTIALAISLDSLKIATNQTSDLIDYYNNFVGDSKTALQIFEDYLPTAESLTTISTLPRFYINGGDCYYFTKDYQTSAIYYSKAIEYADLTGKEGLKALASWYCGITYSDIGQFGESALKFQDAISIFEALKDTTYIQSTKTSIYILYSQNGFYKEAKAVRDEVIELSLKREDYGSLASNYYNAAIDEKSQGNREAQIENLLLALKNGKLSKQSQIQTPPILSSLVIAYSQINDLTNAKDYLEQLNNMYDAKNSNRFKNIYLEAQMYYTLATKDYRKVQSYINEYSELIKNEEYGRQQDFQLFLHDFYKALNDEGKALVHYKNYSRIKDSITSVQKSKALSYYQTIYETEKKALIIESQENDIKLLEEKARVKNQYIFISALSVFFIFGIVLSVRSRNRAKHQKEMQEEFSKKLLMGQEEERNRIAKDLHDSVGQQLTLIKRKAQNDENAELVKLTSDTLDEVRSISQGLYPSILKQLGLTASIEQLILQYDEQTDIFFTSEIDNIDQFFDEAASLNFYRFIQEALSNIVKHSKATEVALSIKADKSNIQFKLSDNGVGFDAEKEKYKNSLGLKTLAERIRILKSQLQIKSQANKGTSINVQIPVIS